ncbi:hypothetical protein [Anderseniella sp. Alg231-50]|uniref:hypothetical protein n=1 Tax=Anderseniella sp. Alg231-50 TaxID=1922226 RepID=UPI00307C929C
MTSRKFIQSVTPVPGNAKPSRFSDVEILTWQEIDNLREEAKRDSEFFDEAFERTTG